jgi:hypothetical protein
MAQVYGLKTSCPVEHKSWKGADPDTPKATLEAQRQDRRDHFAPD